jgi:hypothetical protein
MYVRLRYLYSFRPVSFSLAKYIMAVCTITNLSLIGTLLFSYFWYSNRDSLQNIDTVQEDDWHWCYGLAATIFMITDFRPGRPSRCCYDKDFDVVFVFFKWLYEDTDSRRMFTRINLLNLRGFFAYHQV